MEGCALSPGAETEKLQAINRLMGKYGRFASPPCRSTGNAIRSPNQRLSLPVPFSQIDPSEPPPEEFDTARGESVLSSWSKVVILIDTQDLCYLMIL